jgi:hypothetical protein
MRTLFERGYVAAQLVQALHYKPECCRVDSRWGLKRFFIYITFPAALWPWGSTRPLTEQYSRVFSLGGGGGGKGGRCLELTVMRRFSKLLAALNFWDPQGIFRLVQG